MKDDNMSDVQKCSKCGSAMKEISRRNVKVEVDAEDLTEGQLADYEAADMYDLGDWAALEITYECTKCGYQKTIEHI